MNWIEVPSGKYKLITGKSKRSRCQIELKVRFGFPLIPSIVLSNDSNCSGQVE